MLRKTIGLLAILLVSQVGVAAANSDNSFSLRQLLEAASRSNPSLKTAYFDKDAATGSSTAAAGADDFVLGSSLSYNGQKSPLIPGRNPIQQTVGETISGTVSVSRSLPTGGQVGVSVSGRTSVQQFQNLLDNNVVLDPAQTSTSEISANFSHPLLRGAGSSVARANRKSAELQLSVAELEVRRQAIATIQEVSDAYWGLVLAKEIVKVRESAVKDAEKELKASVAAIRAGTIPSSSKRVVEHRIAVRQQEVVSAKLDVAERSLALRILVGLEVGPDDVYIETADRLSMKDRRFRTEETIQLALEQNPGLAQARLGVESAQIQTRVAKDGQLPQLDASVNGSLLGISNNLGDSASQLGKGNNYQISAQLSFQYEILNRAGKGSAQAAKARSEIARIGLRQTERTLKSQVIMGIYRVRGAYQNIRVGRTAVELAEKNLSSERTKFRAGRSSTFQVLERQAELRDARISLAQSISSHRQAVSTVDTLTGEILVRSGIRFVDIE